MRTSKWRKKTEKFSEKMDKMYDVHPKLLKGKRWVLKQNRKKKKKVGACSFIRNILGVRNCVGALGWD